MGNSLEENKDSECVSSKMPSDDADEEYLCLAGLALPESYEALSELMKKEDFHYSFATLLSYVSLLHGGPR